jgi:hypothetical protein
MCNMLAQCRSQGSVEGVGHGGALFRDPRRLDSRPEIRVLQHIAFTNLAAGMFDDRLQLRRVGHEQPFDFVFILDAQNNCDRPAVAGHDHRPRCRFLKKTIELRSDVCNRGYFQNSTIRVKRRSDITTNVV